eukprot:CAMPEP_0183710214 /NCGR_PEP_ID=MMETSP0737-20130205/6010_1 /TAXON_ID=385413 /ORGANISM="Thalassiosira miniscula, Strain CCMP1093" /LENGTH=306 /DNA_ID=CAMNT_0025938443 /DNA_START=61 /DNA_END=978 /DNA_ORIENTATION=-
MTTANANLFDEFRSSSLNPSLLQSLLHRLLSHPKIHNGFVDVLKLPSVQDAISKITDESKRAALIKTVELFAFGTINEYYELQERGEVWTLNEAQLEKLRMLSVVSIAGRRIGAFHSSLPEDVEMIDDASKLTKSKTKKKNNKKKKKKKSKEESLLSVSYSQLASELHIPGDGGTFDDSKHVRQLEDLLIQCVYSNLLSGKLDQASKSLRVEPHVALTHEASSSSGGGATGGGGTNAATRGANKKDPSSHGGVYGSVFSRDLNTTSESSTKEEVSRMIGTLQQFLKRSNALVETLETSSKLVASDR